MDDFFTALEPRLARAMALEYRGMLRAVGGGQVYAAAVAHADGMAWRLDLNTEEALAASSRENGVVPGNAGGSDDLDDLDDLDDARWVPDEWGLIDRLEYETPTAALEDEVREHADGVPDEDWSGFVRGLVAVLCAALGSEAVRAEFAAAGASPILFVADTDGDAGPTVESLQRLNPEPADRRLLLEAMRFWSAEL